MKKLIFLLFTITFIASTSNAQTIYRVEKNKYEYVYTGVASVTVGSVNTTCSYILTPQKVDALYSNQQLSISKTGGTLDLSIKFQGKYFYSDSIYTDIATATFKGSITDTLINCAQFTTKLGYNYYKILVTRINGTAKINKYKAFYRKEKSLACIKF